LNFGDFFNLDFNIDSDGKLWPDVYSQFTDEDTSNDKKGKKEKK